MEQVYQKTINLFLVDGNSNGTIICNIKNWDANCLKIPRTKIYNCLNRSELQMAGIYFLFNINDDKNSIYIGEAENVYERLTQHLAKKEFYECITFTSIDLNKALVKYLESSLYNEAELANRYVIENKNVPTKSKISEYDEAAMREFIDYVKMATNILGHKVFEKIIKQREADINKLFYINSIGVRAMGMPTEEGFVVFKGSKCFDHFREASSDSLRNRWVKLKEDNIIDKYDYFTEDVLFTSPSLAAAMVLCRNANGLTEWKDANKKSLKNTML